MSREGFLNRGGEGCLDGPAFEGSSAGCFPFPVFVSFGELPESMELSEGRFLPMVPNEKR